MVLKYLFLKKNLYNEQEHIKLEVIKKIKYLKNSNIFLYSPQKGRKLNTCYTKSQFINIYYDYRSYVFH